MARRHTRNERDAHYEMINDMRVTASGQANSSGTFDLRSMKILSYLHQTTHIAENKVDDVQ